MISVSANGASIPALGFGTWDLRGEDAVRAVAGAIELGYRHIDTAQRYQNESEVGRGIRNSGIERGQLFVTTKIWPDCYDPGRFEPCVQESVDKLGVGPVDLLLLHWPNKTRPLAETIGLLNWALEQGHTRHIGVSNFTKAMLVEACSLSAAPLVCNQVEYHPFLAQETVYDACRRQGMALTAYCPLARGQVIDDPTIADIAKRHGKSATQVSLRWLVQQPGVIAIPKTGSSERAAGNLDIFDFSLTEADMQALHGLSQQRRRLVNLDLAPDWD